MKNILLFVVVSFVVSACTRGQGDIAPNTIVPTPQQIAYQEMEFIGFAHFTVNTFTDKEWGYGDESEKVFNPTDLNTEQWAKTAAEVGMKELILTAKHHDGFCLWPSKFTEHSVKNSSWKNGQGDVVKEFTDACRKFGIKAGLYLSPWDRNNPAYGTADYITYYRNQLQELLTNYGKISEIWFDGANGGDGYYGGAKETRKIDRKTYYDWPGTIKLVKSLQPDIIIFSDAGPGCRWIGNENGFAGETNWSMVNTDSIVIGASDLSYLNSGDEKGNKWVVGECDVSIRPGWFYHEKENGQVKSPQKLVDLYYKSVGRNAVMLLNVPPDQRGLWMDTDIQSLKEFSRILDETFKTNLALGKTVTANNYRSKNPRFAPSNILGSDQKTYWAADDDVKQATLEVELDSELEFDRIMLQEPIRFGQRVEKFSVEGFVNNHWQHLANGTTIGYKRLLRIGPVKASKVRVIIEKANNTLALCGFGLFKSSPDEKSTGL